MKKYLVEFTHGNGQVETVELITDRLEWSIDQWCRNRFIVDYKVINEDTSSNNKRMLFG